MSEMEVRVARAIRDFYLKTGHPLQFNGMASTAIAAMREPTQEMLEAGEYEIPVADLDELPKDIARACWQAMVNAARAGRATK